MLLVIFLSILLTTITFVQLAPIENESNKNLEFILLHNNDLHGRFEQIDQNGNKCTDELATANKCYGGFARIAHLVRKYRKDASKPNGKPVLFLNAGDTFTGTVWFSLFKNAIASKFLNLLEPNALTLGNHEFDLGVNKLRQFLLNIKYPVVVSNLDLSKTPKLDALLLKSKIIDLNGIQIGIVGYVTPSTMYESSVSNVLITPEIQAINAEVEQLKEKGIKIIIALGHSGIEVDKKVAEQCPDVDIVVGAHSHTFLYTGKTPDIEIPEGPYPVVITQSNGKKVPVVQAFSFTKYLGYLDVKFDANGNLLEWNGSPVLLDSTIPQDQDILDELEMYRPEYEALNRVISSTDVYLNGSCRHGECNLGNLITDSMLYVREKDRNANNLKQDAVAAFAQAGGIKSSIAKGNVTYFDILNAQSYNNTLLVANVTGQTVLNALERSAYFYGNMDDGGYLHFSGLKVIFDKHKAIGQRVIEVKIRCLEDCEKNESYVPLDLMKTYLIVFTKFLFNGGDEYKWTDNENPLSVAEFLNWTDYTALKEIFIDNNPIKPIEIGRQIFQ